MTEPSLGEMFNLAKTATSSPRTAPVGPRPPATAAPSDRDSGNDDLNDDTRPPSARRGRRRNLESGGVTGGRRPVRALPDVGAPDRADDPDLGATTTSRPLAVSSSEVAVAPDPATAANSHDSGLGGRASLMLYTTSAVAQAMRVEAAASSLTYGQLTLICVENTVDQLREIFAGRAGVTSRLFSTNYRSRAREGQEKRGSGLNLHIARSDLEILDRLWRDMPGCKSRNDLLTTACELHLLLAERTEPQP